MDKISDTVSVRVMEEHAVKVKGKVPIWLFIVVIIAAMTLAIYGETMGCGEAIAAATAISFLGWALFIVEFTTMKPIDVLIKREAEIVKDKKVEKIIEKLGGEKELCLAIKGEIAKDLVFTGAKTIDMKEYEKIVCIYKPRRKWWI